MAGKAWRRLILGVGLLAASGQGRGEEAQILIENAQLRVAAEYRAEAVYWDHGLTRGTPAREQPTTSFAVSAANFLVEGIVSRQVEVKLRVKLLDFQTPDAVDEAYGLWHLTPLTSVSVGRQKVMQGGWSWRTHDYRSHTVPAQIGMFAMPEFRDMVAVHLRAAGEVELQVMNDLTRAAGAEWSTGDNATWAIGWRGVFGPLRPLLDFGSYDHNHARWVDMGLLMQINDLTASLDLFTRRIVHKDPDPESAIGIRENVDTVNAVTWRVAYTWVKVAQGFFSWSGFTNREGEDPSVPGRFDRLTNTVRAGPTGEPLYVFDDNAREVAIGVDALLLGEGVTPFAAVVRHSGDFASDGAATGRATRAETWVKVGLMGRL